MKKQPISPIKKKSQALLKTTSSEQGVLLLHGFKGSPYEMKFLGEKLARDRYTIYIPRLPGHGTTLEDMASTTGRDWHITAYEALVELKSYCREISVVGLSMGGILGLLLAQKYSIKKLALLSVPRTIPDKTIYLAPIVGLFKKIMWQDDPIMGLASEEARKIHEAYNTGIPLSQSWYLFRLIRKAMKALPEITSDVCLMQSRSDSVIPADSIDYIYKHISSPKKDKLLLEKSDHAITLDLEKDIVAEYILKFLNS